MSYLPSNPGLADLAGVFAKYPRRGILLFKLLEDIKMNCSPLGQELRELIIAYISGLNRSEFCYSTHKALCSEWGVDVAVFDQLRIDIDSAGVDENIKPILHYVKKLTLAPDQITQVDAQRIFDAGWDERTFLDCISICAIVNCMNRFVIGLGIAADATSARRAGFDLIRDRKVEALAGQV